MGRPPKPGSIVVPNTIEVKTVWDIAGQRFTNVLHGNWTTGGSPDAALAETLFSGFKVQFTSSGWATQCTDSLQFTAVSVRDIRTAANPEYLSSGAAAAGADTTGSATAGAALVVTLLTAKAGREWRGRVFLGGLGAIASADARHHTATAGTAALAFVEGLRTVMSAQSCPMVIAQRELLAGTDSNDNPLPARPANNVPVTATKIASTRLDTQRRRLGR